MNPEREEKIRLHCTVLAEVIIAIRPIYHRAEAPQTAFLETMIGAAIWYVPNPIEAWTGKISKNALLALHPDNNRIGGKLSEEHVYSRKNAARRLLKDEALTADKMERVFREEYGRFHYITSEENKAVVKYRKAGVFSTPEDAYRQAGIELIGIERSDLRLIKKRDRDTIEKYTKSNANNAGDSTTPRVTPPADSSLRSGQESRHGQP